VQLCTVTGVRKLENGARRGHNEKAKEPSNGRDLQNSADPPDTNHKVHGFMPAALASNPGGNPDSVRGLECKELARERIDEHRLGPASLYAGFVARAEDTPAKKLGDCR